MRQAEGGESGQGAFGGYASLFNRVDTGRDMVRPGAFAKSLHTRGSRGIKMLYQHNPAEPIGTWVTLREDAHGLYVRGRLAVGSTRGWDVAALLKAGALDGLSIGFQVVKARTQSHTQGRSGIRELLEVDLWEISLVTFPMLPQARVGSPRDGFRPAVAAKQQLAPAAQNVALWPALSARLHAAKTLMHSQQKGH